MLHGWADNNDAGALDTLDKLIQTTGEPVIINNILNDERTKKLSSSGDCRIQFYL